MNNIDSATWSGLEHLNFAALSLKKKRMRLTSLPYLELTACNFKIYQSTQNIWYVLKHTYIYNVHSLLSFIKPYNCSIQQRYAGCVTCSACLSLTAHTCHHYSVTPGALPLLTNMTASLIL